MFFQHLDQFFPFLVHSFCSRQPLLWFLPENADVTKQPESLEEVDLLLCVTFLDGHHVVTELRGHDLRQLKAAAFDVALNLDQCLRGVLHPEHGTVLMRVVAAYGAFAFMPLRLIGSHDVSSTMSGNHAIALTGTPGVGKSSLAEALRAEGWGTVDVEDAARDHGCLGETEADGAAPLDVHALSERWSPPDENIVVDGHLSHFLDVTAVVLLRCSPDLIRDRLAPRGYNDAKIQANVEWELTAGHWSELLEFEIDVPVLELDASKRSTASLAAEVLAWLADGCPAPPLLEAAAAATDWLNE